MTSRLTKVRLLPAGTWMTAGVNWLAANVTSTSPAATAGFDGANATAARAAARRGRIRRDMDGLLRNGPSPTSRGTETRSLRCVPFVPYGRAVHRRPAVGPIADGTFVPGCSPGN